MAEFAHLEGENVTYLYNGPTDPQVVGNEIKDLLDQTVDLLFVIANPTLLPTKQAVAGTDTPVVFAMVADPVGQGYVESVSQPGGNITGVQGGLEIAKSLEWLVRITPNAKKIYVPFNPADKISLRDLAWLEEAAAHLGVELVPGEVPSVEAAVAAVEKLPQDIDAISRLSSPTLDPRNIELSQAAIRRGLPMAAFIPMDDTVLLTLSIDMFELGKQAARLANQIRQGAKPADLPIETPEFYLSINLKTAHAIGLDIPDDILHQADTIIR
jgi:putative ABC transport system substrate-binding protein